VQVVYVAAVTISTGIWLADFSVILGIVSSVIFAFANRAYYQRRAELFVN